MISLNPSGMPWDFAVAASTDGLIGARSGVLYATSQEQCRNNERAGVNFAIVLISEVISSRLMCLGACMDSNAGQGHDFQGKDRCEEA
jgi:hypothetical protein